MQTNKHTHTVMGALADLRQDPPRVTDASNKLEPLDIDWKSPIDLAVAGLWQVHISDATGDCNDAITYLELATESPVSPHQLSLPWLAMYNLGLLLLMDGTKALQAQNRPTAGMQAPVRQTPFRCFNEAAGLLRSAGFGLLNLLAQHNVADGLHRSAHSQAGAAMSLLAETLFQLRRRAEAVEAAETALTLLDRQSTAHERRWQSAHGILAALGRTSSGNYEVSPGTFGLEDLSTYPCLQ